MPFRQQIRFATTSDGVKVAFAESGKGDPLVRAGHWMTHLEWDWQTPGLGPVAGSAQRAPSPLPLRLARLRPVGPGHSLDHAGRPRCRPGGGRRCGRPGPVCVAGSFARRRRVHRLRRAPPGARQQDGSARRAGPRPAGAQSRCRPARNGRSRWRSWCGPAGARTTRPSGRCSPPSSSPMQAASRPMLSTTCNGCPAPLSTPSGSCWRSPRSTRRPRWPRCNVRRWSCIAWAMRGCRSRRAASSLRASAMPASSRWTR